MAAHELSEPAGSASRWTARLYAAQLALELAAAHPDDVVLDLATGTGALLRLLAARRERPRVAVGVDASAAMLERVPQLPEDWRLINGDARRIPLPDESVDVVMCAYLMHLLDEADRRMVLREIARVLRPRGRAVIVGLLEPRGLAGRALLAPVQRALCRCSAQRRAGAHWIPATNCVTPDCTFGAAGSAREATRQSACSPSATDQRASKGPRGARAIGPQHLG